MTLSWFWKINSKIYETASVGGQKPSVVSKRHRFDSYRRQLKKPDAMSAQYFDSTDGIYRG